MKYITSIWTTIAIIVLGLFIRISDPDIVQQFRLITFDQYIQSLPDKESEDIVLINIGEESLEKYGQWPFPRHQFAQMISDLRNANAGLIGFTIMFPENDRFGGDEVFSLWVKDNGIILSQDADPRGRSESAPYVGTAIFGTGDPNDWVIEYDGLVTNIPEIEQGAWGHGLINGMPEVDGVVRRIPLLSQINEQLYPSFTLELIRVANQKPSYTVKVNDTGIEEIILRPFQIPTDPNGSIWINTNYSFPEIEYGSDLPNLEGKVVLIGLTASGLASQIPTPVGLQSAHQLQASAIQTVLDESSISRPLWTAPLEILVSTVLAALLVLLVYRAPVWVSGIGFLVFCLGSVVTVYYVWNKWYVLLDLTYSLILYIISFTSGSFNNFYKQYMLRQQVKKQFETYLDPRQVMLLQKDPSLLKLGGKREEMSFLFMDIVGFTPISEHYKNNNDPEGLVKIINNYLDRMSKIILKNGGTIDKYMGDCIMAFWNAPLPCKNHADMAVRTSIEILEAADELIKELEEQGLPRIDVGIGINTGDCIVGNMGSESRFDYSVIGDAVNLAARLEGQTRNYDGVRVLLSQFTAGKCSERSFTQVDNIQVKGKSERVTILTV